MNINSAVAFQVKEVKGHLDVRIHFWIGSKTTQVNIFQSHKQ